MSNKIDELNYYNKAKRCVKKIFAVVNERKQSAILARGEIISKLSVLGINCEFVDLSAFMASMPLPGDLDAFLSIGGDGTLLALVDAAIELNKPIIGVNCGYMGFLTMFSVADFIECAHEIMHGEMIESERTTLVAEDSNGNKFTALNDVVIKSEEFRLLSSEIFLDSDVLVTKMRSDGIIFSSSTGSTAYNLSANGPVLHPTSSAWCMTPICPHDIFNRSIVFGNEAKILINIQSSADVLIDGRKVFKCNNASMKIYMAEKKLKLVQPKKFSYFKTLRDKFNINRHI